MAVRNVNKPRMLPFQVDVEVDTSADFAAVAVNKFIEVLSPRGYFYKNASGEILSVFSAAALPSFPAGTQSAPGMHFTGDENTGFYRNAEGEVTFVSNANPIFSFTSVGFFVYGFNVLTMNGTDAQTTEVIGGHTGVFTVTIKGINCRVNGTTGLLERIEQDKMGFQLESYVSTTGMRYRVRLIKMDNAIVDLFGIEWDTTNGLQISMPNLPTSSAGLTSGRLWRNGTVLNIV